MLKPVLVICNTEITYANKLYEIFYKKKDLPFEIQAFTKSDVCKEYCKKNKVELLIIDESSFEPEMEQFDISCRIILQEQGQKKYENSFVTSKYQSASSIFRETMKLYAQQESAVFPINHVVATSHEIIGFYSPIHRCGQTTMALCMSKVLAERGRTLYMNFESYSGFTSCIENQKKGNIIDLLYYYDCDKDKLAYHIRGIVQKYDNFDMIPPGYSYFEFSEVEADKWVDFIQEIALLGDYKYVVLDLSEPVKGLLEILKKSKRVYMAIPKEKELCEKVQQYEENLYQMGYQIIVEKTIKFRQQKDFQYHDMLETSIEMEMKRFCENLLTIEGKQNFEN